MEIMSGIHQVDGVNGNSYIVAREVLTIIDTGLPGSSAKIINYITGDLRRNPSEISTIVLTHAHVDHVGSITKMKQAAPGAKVAVHTAEAAYIRGEISGERYQGRDSYHPAERSDGVPVAYHECGEKTGFFRAGYPSRGWRPDRWTRLCPYSRPYPGDGTGRTF